MTKLSVQFIGGTYQHPSRPANFQRCVNWYPTTSNPTNPQSNNNPLYKGRNVATLLRTIGCTSIGTINETGIDPRCRGLYQIQLSIGVYLTVIVIGENVYNLNFDYTTKTINPVLIGTLQTFKGNVVISSNATQIIFVCYDTYNNLKKGSIYNYITNTFTHITDLDFLGGSHVVMIDGYFIYNQIGSSNMLSCDLNDGLTWDATKIARAESSSDKIIALGQTKGEMWVFGTNSIEVWYDAGNSPGFPFSKRVGSDMDVGCSAPYSIVSVSGNLMWLDSRRFIVVSDFSQFFRSNSSGYQATKLSTESIDAEIGSYATVSDCLASTYVDNGHVMAEFSFPSEEKTWVYDATMDMWHERSYHLSSNNIEYQSLTNFYVQNEKYTIAASLANNKVYLVSRDYLDDDGEKIHRIRTTHHINDSFKQLAINEVELKCNTGLQNHIQQYANVLSTTINSFTTKAATTTITGIASDYPQLKSVLMSAISFNGTNWNITLRSTLSGVVAAGQLFIIYYGNNNSITLGKILSLVGTTMVVDGNLIINSTPLNPLYINASSFASIGQNSFSANPVLFGTPNATVATTNVFNVGDTVRVTLHNGTTVDFDIENILADNRIVPPSSPIPAYIPYNIGDSILNLDAVAVNTITVSPGTVELRIGDSVSIRLNDGSIFNTTVTAVTGGVITIADPILSTKLTAGNEIEFQRTNTEHQTAHIGLRYSNDSGYTWSSSMDRELGALGQYGKRINWNCLGSHNEWLFEVKIVDPIDISIVDSYVDGFLGDI